VDREFGRSYASTPLLQTIGCDPIFEPAYLLMTAVIYECTPEAHDRAVAWISHLPVLVSAGLILACGKETDGAIAQLSQHLASSGFRDTSRVGGGNPQLGRLIAEYNQVALLDSLKQYQSVLADLITQAELGNWEVLEQSLKLAQQLRNLYIVEQIQF